MEEKKTRRSGIQIMANLIGLVKPLIAVMILAITLGVLGFLCAIFLTVFAGKSLYLVHLKETAAAYQDRKSVV